MKQRLAIAAALLTPRDLIILDEPTNGLDPQGTREVRTLVRQIAADGITVFVSSHLLAEVEQVSTHVGVMRLGKLVFQGELAELRRTAAPRVAVRTGDVAAAAEVLAKLGLADPVARGRRWSPRSSATPRRRRSPRNWCTPASACAPDGGGAQPRGSVRRPDRGGLRCRALRSLAGRTAPGAETGWRGAGAEPHPFGLICGFSPTSCGSPSSAGATSCCCSSRRCSRC